MPHKSETRAVMARASRNSCGGCFRDSLSPLAIRAQLPILATHMGLAELAAMIAALAFGGGAHV